MVVGLNLRVINALQYADEPLKDNKDIVIAAVKQEPVALKWASPRLKKDKKIVMLATQKYDKAIEYADRKLHTDEDVINAYLSSCYKKGLDFEGGVISTLKEEYENLLKEQKIIIQKQNKIRLLLIHLDPSYVRKVDEKEKIKVKKMK